MTGSAMVPFIIPVVATAGVITARTGRWVIARSRQLSKAGLLSDAKYPPNVPVQNMTEVPVI
jgi:hypothetical protein